MSGSSYRRSRISNSREASSTTNPREKDRYEWAAFHVETTRERFAASYPWDRFTGWGILVAAAVIAFAPIGTRTGGVIESTFESAQQAMIPAAALAAAAYLLNRRVFTLTASELTVHSEPFFGLTITRLATADIASFITKTSRHTRRPRHYVVAVCSDGERRIARFDPGCDRDAAALQKLLVEHLARLKEVR